MLKRIALILLAASAIAAAQDKAPPPPPPPPPPPGRAVVYRLEYTITETEGTKKVNARTYTMLVEDHKSGSIRVGNKVPLQNKDGAIQYFDVGVNIDGRPTAIDSASVRLNTIIENTSVVVAEAATAKAPVVRNLRNSIELGLPLDKPVVLTTQDDPGSNTTIQVQVLAKQVK